MSAHLDVAGGHKLALLARKRRGVDLEDHTDGGLLHLRQWPHEDSIGAARRQGRLAAVHTVRGHKSIQIRQGALDSPLTGADHEQSRGNGAEFLVVFSNLN